jgi:glycosyltransferase involved in cell wall biosynthesis
MSFKQSRLSVSIVIPVYNGGESFQHCLAKLAEVSPDPAEVIVVADGDTDGSWQRAEAFGAKVIRKPSPEGPAKARNLGAQAAQGDILLFIDADVEATSTIVERVAIAFEQAPNLAALIGSYDDAPGAPNFLSQYRNLLHHYVHQVGNREAFTFWGACGAIRRDVFLAVGGFDETYRKPCIEDIELGYRLRRAGYKIELHKDIQVKHLKRWEVDSMLKADFFYRALPWTALILREGKLANDLNLQVSNRASVMLTFAMTLALLGAFGWSGWLILAGVFLMAFLALNFPVYRWFAAKRGLLFAIRVVPWHWFFYFYSGVAFAIGIIRHQLLARTPKDLQIQSSN